MCEPVVAFLGIGANLGKRAEMLRNALIHLNKHDEIAVERASPVYETAPVGVTDQPSFLNAVVSVKTSLSARLLLDVLLETELYFGRKRIKKWGPRILDLDILLYGEAIIDEPNLSVPHPYLHLRGFVLHPLCDLVPERIHPVLRRSFASFLADVDDGAVTRVEHLALWE